MKDVLAFLAAVLAIVSVVPYVIDVLRKRSKPNIVSWTTWTLLTGVATAAAFAAHEPRTALLTAGGTIATGTVVAVGLRNGIAKFSLFDGLCQGGALLGLLLWLIFNSPTIGIVVPVTIDFIAVLPTMRHAWKAPREETWQTFFIGAVTPCLTLISLEHYGLDALLYPIYLIIANGLLTLEILYRRRSRLS